MGHSLKKSPLMKWLYRLVPFKSGLMSSWYSLWWSKSQYLLLIPALLNTIKMQPDTQTFAHSCTSDWDWRGEKKNREEVFFLVASPIGCERSIPRGLLVLINRQGQARPFPIWQQRSRAGAIQTAGWFIHFLIRGLKAGSALSNSFPWNMQPRNVSHVLQQRDPHQMHRLITGSVKYEYTVCCGARMKH